MTLDMLIERWQAIGLKPVLLNALFRFYDPASDAAPDLRRIVEVQRDHVLVHDGSRVATARVLPALRERLLDEDDALAVGDWVLLRPDDFGDAWVRERLPPLTRIARRQFDERNKVRRAAIVHNVDALLIVMGLDHDFNLRRLDRYVTLARLAGVSPVLVLSKADVGSDVERRVVQARERFRAELPVLPLDARDPAAAAALAPWLMPGDTLAVLGSSGAGKSTLTNTLLGESLQLTGAARAGDGRGRHTTTVRSLHRLPGGACLIDTPGLRTLRLEADEAALDVAHGEVAELALGCRFRDCRHQAEPGCAVRAGLDADRLKSYHRLQREARRDTLTVLQRQRQLGEWKSIHKSVRTRMAVKRG